MKVEFEKTKVITTIINGNEVIDTLINRGEKATLEFIIELLDNLYRRTGSRFYIALQDGEDIYLVGEAVDDWMDDAEVGRYGECENCNVKVCSWAKDAYCPVCKKDVYLV